MVTKRKAEPAGERFVALEKLSHSGNGRYYEPGEEVPLDHLEDGERAMLVQQGIVSGTAPRLAVEEVGVSPEAAVRLWFHGVRSLEDLSAATPATICAVGGLAYAEAQACREKAADLLVEPTVKPTVKPAAKPAAKETPSQKGS